MKRFVFILVSFLLSLSCHAYSLKNMMSNLSIDNVMRCNEDSVYSGWTEEQYKALEDSVMSNLYPSVTLVESDTVVSILPAHSLYMDMPMSNSIVPTSISVNTNNLVGEITIISKETETGAKAYEVPLELPQGMNNFAPQLSLYYNSQKGNSVLGKGWSLNGVSEIVRGNRTFYYDGIAEGIIMNAEDAFYLDGMRLIRLDISEDMVLYETETGNVKVKAHVSAGSINYFEVFYPNGNKGVYGFVGNTQNQMFYPLKSLNDLNGNVISYSYEYEDNHYRISAISYNGSSVNFLYQQRNDPIITYSGGLKIQETKLLKEIVCNYNNTPFRTYVLSYNSQSNETCSSLLESIGCTFGNEEVNPITFYYGTGNTISSYTSSSKHLTSSYISSNPDRIATRLGKINPYSDAEVLIAYPNENPYWQHYRHSTFFQHSQNRFDNKFSGTERILISGELDADFSLPESSVYTEAGFVDLLCSDLDGAQRESFIKINNIVSGDKDHVIFKEYKSNVITGLYLSNTSTYDFSTVYTDADGNRSIQPKFYFSGDFDGNGKMEILAVSAHNPFGDTSKPSRCYVFDLHNNSVQFQDAVFEYNVDFVGTRQTDSAAANNNSDKLMVFDYDGDGKTDICHINEEGIHIYTFVVDGPNWQCQLVASSTTANKSQLANRDILLGEINGDGLIDMVFTSSTAGGYDWKILNSKGDGTFDANTVYYLPNRDGCKFLLQDVNGDGLTDLLSYTSSGFNTYLSRNNGFDLNSIYTPFVEESSKLIAVNINSHNNFTNVISLKNSNVVSFSFSQDKQKEELITGMINSLGLIERNEYHYINHEGYEYGAYSSGNEVNFPYISINERIPVLAFSETYMNGNQIKSDRYHYANAVYHRQGLGFCGFGSIVKRDLRSHATVKSYNPYQYGVLISEETPISRTEFTYDIIVDRNKLRKQLVSEIYNINKMIGVESESQYSYNSVGLPVSESTTYTGGLSVSTQKEYSDNSVVGDGYILGQVTNTVVSKISDGDIVTERIYIPEYCNGLPVSKQTFINNNIVSQNYYTYDACGNMLTESTRQYNSDDTTTVVYAYDNQGHVLRKTDKSGNVERYTYGTNGMVRTHTDQYGNIETFSYDVLGRVVSVVDDENVRRSITYEWDSQGTNGLYAISKSGTAIPTSKNVYDALRRKVRTSDIRFDGSELKVDMLYDVYGNLIAKSIPFKSEATLWNTYSYDDYNRIWRFEAPSGNITNCSYQWGNNRVEIECNGNTTTKVFDAMGNLVSVTDDSGTITYNLAADGKPIDVLSVDNNAIHFEYDQYRRCIRKEDPSFGIVEYGYDDDGYLSEETSANNETTYYSYDSLGRLVSKVSPEFSSTYTYNSYNDLTSVVSTNGTKAEYTYDNRGRVSLEKHYANDDVWFSKSYIRGAGLLRGHYYMSDRSQFGLETFLYSNNRLSEIKFNGTSIMSIDSENELGLPTNVTTGGIDREYEYSAEGFTTKRKAICSNQILQSLALSYDSYGNVVSRTDETRNLSESFNYDNLNRLISVNGNEIEYDLNGNIRTKPDVGSFEYNNATKPYALTDAVLSSDVVAPQINQRVKFTSFHRPNSIVDGDNSASFQYNHDGKRVKMQITRSEFLVRRRVTELTRYYLADQYERDSTSNGVAERLYLGGDYYKALGVMVKDENSHTYFYNILHDQLGSITHILSSDGTIIQELNYDVWGRLRDCGNYSNYLSTQPTLFLGRGFTGHEHLSQFGLINMNARMYDPLFSRFLSPDPHIQSDSNSQNFNRYSYCLNNPLRYNDPSGELFIFTCINAIWEFGTNLIKHGFNVSQYNWKRTINSWKIDMGMFKGNALQILNKWTWGYNVSSVGNLVAQFSNVLGIVDKVSNLEGMLAMSGITNGGKAFTIGFYSFGPDNYVADWRDHLFVHEYGHYIQSQRWGDLFFPVIAIPSLISAGNRGPNHKNSWFEKDASALGGHYFDRKHGRDEYGNVVSDEFHFNYKLFKSGGDTPYVNPRTGSQKQKGYFPEDEDNI